MLMLFIFQLFQILEASNVEGSQDCSLTQICTQCRCSQSDDAREFEIVANIDECAVEALHFEENYFSFDVENSICSIQLYLCNIDTFSTVSTTSEWSIYRLDCDISNLHSSKFPSLVPLAGWPQTTDDRIPSKTPTVILSQSNTSIFDTIIDYFIYFLMAGGTLFMCCVCFYIRRPHCVNVRNTNESLKSRSFKSFRTLDSFSNFDAVYISRPGEPSHCPVPVSGEPSVDTLEGFSTKKHIQSVESHPEFYLPENDANETHVNISDTMRDSGLDLVGVKFSDVMKYMNSEESSGDSNSNFLNKNISDAMMKYMSSTSTAALSDGLYTKKVFKGAESHPDLFHPEDSADSIHVNMEKRFTNDKTFLKRMSNRKKALKQMKIELLPPIESDGKLEMDQDSDSEGEKRTPECFDRLDASLPSLPDSSNDLELVEQSDEGRKRGPSQAQLNLRRPCESYHISI